MFLSGFFARAVTIGFQPAGARHDCTFSTASRTFLDFGIEILSGVLWSSRIASFHVHPISRNRGPLPWEWALDRQFHGRCLWCKDIFLQILYRSFRLQYAKVSSVANSESCTLGPSSLSRIRTDQRMLLILYYLNGVVHPLRGPLSPASFWISTHPFWLVTDRTPSASSEVVVEVKLTSSSSTL